MNKKKFRDTQAAPLWWKKKSFEKALSKQRPKSHWNVAGFWNKNFMAAELKQFRMKSQN